MSNNSDFDDFFDSPGRPSNPAPSERLKRSISSDDESKWDSERNSIVSSARSGASIKIEAHVPSIASELRSDSDDELGNSSYQLRKPPRPKSNKQKTIDKTIEDMSLYQRSRLDAKPKKTTAWDVPSHKPNRRMASSIADAQHGDNYISSATGKKMRKGRCQYSDTESDSNSEVYSSDNNDCIKRHSRYQSHSSESCSSSSRSRSSSGSSKWSTGSEGRRSKTPRTPVGRHGQSNHKSKLSRGRSRSHSDDTLSISSLSGSEVDTARPASRSAHVQAPKSLGHTGEDKDKMNLHRLLAALLENEDEQQRTGHSSHRIPSSNKNKESSNKGNYTFSSDKARKIDMENQRLLQNILSQRTQGSALTTTKTPQPNKKYSNIRVAEPARVTHATLNRMRERQRVERENLALLRRLHKIKPSAEISRTKQLESYTKQMSYHSPLMRTGNAGARSRSAQGLISTGSSTGCRSRPSSASYTQRPVSATNSRPNSAYSNASTMQRKPRPSSAKTGPKPDWETGW